MVTPALAVAAALLAPMVYYSLLFFYRAYRLRNFPGPLAFPLVGNYYTSELAQFYGYVGKLRKKYGKWYLLWCGASPQLVCCDANAAVAVLNDTNTFVKGTGYSRIFSVAFGEGLVTASGEKHKKDRSRFHKYFVRAGRPGCVLDQLPRLNRICRDGIEEFFAEKMDNQVVDFETVFARFALRTFGQFALHHDFSQDKEIEANICHLVSHGSFLMGLSVGMQLPMYSFLPWAKPIVDCRRYIVKVLDGPIKERRAAIARGEDVPDDPLTAMLKDNLTQEDIDDHIMTLVCAGHDTTAFFCAYTALLLAKNPDVQERLRAEVQSVMGDRTEVEAEDLTHFVYMRKVFQEVLRFYAVIPGVQRTATKDFHFKELGVTVPEGTTLLIPLFVINRDPELWPDPARFDPERFETTIAKNDTVEVRLPGMAAWQSAKVRNVHPEGDLDLELDADKSAATKVHPSLVRRVDNGTSLYDVKRSYLPFGYGSRMCIGQQLAVVEASVFFAQLLQRFRLSPDPKYRAKIRAGISLTTTNGIKVCVSTL